MSLSQQASQLAAARSTEARQAAQAREDARIAQLSEKIQEELGYTPTWIDRFKYIYNITDLGYRGRNIVEYTYDRWQVDDVTIWTLSERPHSLTAPSLLLERACSSCGKPSVAWANRVVPALFGSNTAQAIANAMVPITCAQCAARVPRDCPTCGRSN